MQDIPDDPQIRNAILNGRPEEPEVRCPCCRRECETLFLEYDGKAGTKGDVVGCEHCITTEDAWKYRAEHKEEFE